MTDEPHDQAPGPREAVPTTTATPPTGRVSYLAWPLSGLATGLIGGAVVGLAEPLLRIRTDPQLMTSRMWFEALSFSAISYQVFLALVCGLAGLVGGLIVWRRPAWKARLTPRAWASAALLSGIAVIFVWARLATLQAALGKRLMTPIWPAVAWCLLLLPTGWLLTKLGRAVPVRLDGRVQRVLTPIAVVLAIGAGIIQWQGRSKIESADGFWPMAATRPASAPARGKPDIVLVVFDTLRADRLGCYGYSRPTSPHVDAFAADAAVFEKAISPGAWTEPAHASIFTGLYRSQHGVGYNRIWLDDRFVTLAELLRDAGYQTIALSNNPNVSPGTNLTQGFDRFEAPYRFYYPTRNSLYGFFKFGCAGGGALGPSLGQWFVYDAGGRATAPLAARLLSRRDRSRPVFLFVNYMEPHWPYEPRRAYRRSMVSEEDLARSYRISQRFEDVFRHTLTANRVYGEREMGILSDLYDARLREMDDYFADLIRTLARQIDLDDSLVILTADHGENIGDHNLLGHNFCVYDSLLHVPLVVRWPRILRPQRVDRIVQTHDLFVTILDWVGVKPKQSGEILVRSLDSALRGSPESVYRNAFAEYLYPPDFAFKLVRLRDPTFDSSPWMVAFKAVYDQRWKLIIRSDRRGELYDLANDPGEKRNLVRSRRREVDRLQRAFAQWRKSFKAFDPNQFSGPAEQTFNADQVRRLRDLGYVQ